MERERVVKMSREKLEDLFATTKVAEILKKKDEESKKNTIMWVLAILGAVVAVAAIAYAVYHYFTPDYLEDFEEDFEDDFEENFFDENDEI